MLATRYGCEDFSDFDDFARNFHIDAPKDFNFAFDCIDEMARRSPDKTAMVWCNDRGDEARYSFAQLSAYSDAAARFFADAGIGRGDAVLLILRRRAQFWFAALGLIKLGAVLIPSTHYLLTEDIVYRNNAASVAAVVTTDDETLCAAVEQSLPQSPTVRIRAKLGAKREGWLSFDEGLDRFAQGETLPRITSGKDMMLLYFTSGTTGMPKMVAHNHLYPLGHITTAYYWHALREDSLHLTMADTGWAKAAWGKIFGQWLCEAAIFVYDQDHLDPHRLLRALARYRVTSFCAPPTVYRVLLTANLPSYDLSALKQVTSAGEPLTGDIFDRFKQGTGLSVREAYGQTETVPLTMTSVYTEPRIGSVGKCNPIYDILFLDADGNEVPEGAEGEICIRAERGFAGLFMGYHRDDAATARVWRGGVYHTGDMARMDSDGYVYFIGRADDIIKSAGYRIGPYEVESVLERHPAVLECAVTGAPHPLRGQIVKASIVLAESYTASDALKKELRAFMRASAAAYKVPREIEFVDELPKTISGKVRRVAMRADEQNENEENNKNG
ncbi:MAG: AMP-binding protein [Clostridiales Family XIII bacterium]|jgi:acetyl-CoA synthetase|nr:AMP-binding protein [Clostridiales Family XIII bacterium]